jgi:hypothetical protein
MEDVMAKSKKATAPKAATKKTVASSDDTPETKTTTKAQQEAAEALFTGADGAVRTEEQHENHVRRMALGY